MDWWLICGLYCTMADDWWLLYGLNWNLANDWWLKCIWYWTLVCCWLICGLYSTLADEWWLICGLHSTMTDGLVYIAPWLMEWWLMFGVYCTLMMSGNWLYMGEASKLKVQIFKSICFWRLQTCKSFQKIQKIDLKL